MTLTRTLGCFPCSTLPATTQYLMREYSVKVDPVNWEGWTPLFCAIRGG